MATNKTISINVDLKTKFEQELSNIKNINKGLTGSGGYAGVGGEERLNKVNNLISSIEKVLNLDTISTEQLTEVKNNFKELFRVLNLVSNSVGGVTGEIKKLQDELSRAQDELDQASKIRDEIASHGKLSNTGKSFVNYEGFNERAKAIGAYRVRNDGTLYKNSLTDFENIRKRVLAGEDIRDAQGNPLKDNPQWKALITELNKYTHSLIQANSVVKEKTEAEAAAMKALKEQVEKEKQNGVTGGGYSVELGESHSRTGANLNKVYEQLARESGAAKTTAEINKLNGALDRQSSALGKAFKAFTIYNIIVKSAKKALREAVTTIKDLDKYLTEQAMVTGKTRKETYALVGEYQKLAKETGATTKEIAGVATEYMKQGKTIQESLTLTKAAVSAAKVARVSVGDSVNYLTTALNGFRLSAEDAMKVSDKFAAVAASSATDYDELAIALSKVASQANLAGMSIDYTTALLTKGLETTREAPETMGTALKTIIARMREMSDYGETLEDGTDINNVETQLAYVGITLRNTEGELRSTEDVLDELGRKWETLDKNQQAAVAKALAGTRQQSRLIAMMEDYDRVIELQEIAQRSQGATLAQSETYLEGIEAAINNISVAWEKIITSLTNSDVIVGAIDLFAWFLDGVGTFLDTTIGSISLVGILAVALTGIISQKIVEKDIANKQLELQKLQHRERLEQRKLEIIMLVLEKQGLKMDEQENRNLAAVLAGLKQKNKLEARSNKIKKEGLTKDVDKGETEKTIKKLNTEAEATKQIADARMKLDEGLEKDIMLKKEYDTIQSKLNKMDSDQLGILSGSVRLMALSVVWTKLSTAAKIIYTIFTGKETKAVDRNTRAILLNKAVRYALIAVILAAAVAIGVFVASLFKSESATEKASKKIKKLSNEIYKLNESKNALDGIIDQFEALDEKVIKTNKDLEEMESLLDGASEKVDFTRGGKFDDDEAAARKANFEALTDQQKINWLKEEQLAIDTEIAKKRQKQLDELQKEGVVTKKLLEDAEIAAAVYATNNAYLYDKIDALKKTGEYTDEELKATEKIGEAILENLSATQALEWANGRVAEKLAQQLALAGSINIDGESIMLSEVLASDAYGLENQIKAYKEIALQLSGETLEAFNKAYSYFKDFASSFSENSISLITNLGITADEINNLAKAMRKLGVEEELLINRMEKLIVYTGNGMGVQDAIKSVFADQLTGLTDEEYKEAYNTILNAWIDATGVGINNMGQELDKLQNKINNFYTNATKWGEMSANEQAQFIADNAELFENNAGLLSAFESGDYATIEKALRGSDALEKQRQATLTQLRTELANEEAKLPENQNVAYKKYLEQQIAYWEDTEKVWKASLKDILDKEKQQLDDYKSYLEEKNKAEEEALNKRKEAYEKYFDSIAEMEEDQDYEDQVDLLSSNLAKLGSSTDANAMNQKKELENQLKELEQERLKELRERAQEAIIENIDDQIAEMNDTLDKLLESNRALLAAMNGELTNTNEFIANRLATEISTGATANELQSWLGNLSSVYGGKLGDINLADMKIREENNNLYLTVNGREVQLDTSSQQSVYDAIMKALTQVGGI